MKSLLPDKHAPKINGVKVNRKVTAFLLCLLVAVLFWFINAMSEYYSMHVTIPVKYINIPKSKVISNDLPSHISGYIKAKGYRLLRYTFYSFKDTLQFDIASFMLDENDSSSYIVSSRVVEKLSMQIKGDVKLLDINPDTLFFYFSKSVSRRVPVKLNISLEFDEQFRLTEKIKFVPESVLVWGDVRTVNNIRSIETEKIDLKKISKNGSIFATLRLENNQKVKLSHEKVKVDYRVAKFTERSIDVPVVIRNMPKKVSLRLFPDKVTVKFLLPLDDYEKTDDSMFKAEVDAAGIMEAQDSRLKVVLVKQPGWVENVSLSPSKVEYIIKK